MSEASVLCVRVSAAPLLTESVVISARERERGEGGKHRIRCSLSHSALDVSILIILILHIDMGENSQSMALTFYCLNFMYFHSPHVTHRHELYEYSS